MSQRYGALFGAIVCGAAVLGAAGFGPAAPPADDAKKTPAKEVSGGDVFGLTKVHPVHVEMTAKEWDKMQPAGGPRFFGGGGGRGGFPGKPSAPEKPPAKPGEEPVEKHRSSFGMEFPWARATFTIGGRALKDVGLRYKGNGSYMPSMGQLKRNLKVELDHYDAEQRYCGLKTLNLNAGAADPTRYREALSFAVYRDAGVPAPRTAFAEAALTVPGKYDKEPLGLYTVVEQVNKTFLRDHFGDDKGLLMKPERLRGVQYLGERWENYTAQYQPKGEASGKQGRRVVEFARLVHKAGDEQFAKEVGSYLDVDQFLRFLAVTALLSSTDSFFTIGHNVYLYLDPRTDKLVFIPWDQDLSFGGFFFYGSQDQQADLSLTRPYIGGDRLIERLLAVKEISGQYQAVLKELSATAFAKDRLLKNLDAVEGATKDVLARERKAAEARKERPGGFGFGPPGQKPDLRAFVTKRSESVAAQLAGKSKGSALATVGFGRGGFGMGNVGDRWAKPLLDALDADKDGKVTREDVAGGVRTFFAECDKDKRGALDESQIAEGINRITPRPPGFGAAGGRKPDGPKPDGQKPGGGFAFGPGQFLAGAVVRRADTNKDGKVTADEAVTAAESLFKEVDKDKAGKLDEKGIGAAFGLLFPPPPGFGQAGRKPPPPGKPSPSEEKRP